MSQWESLRRRWACTMYHEFYGFREPPFNLTPDPRYLFLSDRHREAIQHILFGIRERKGFVLITGDVGAGKTTVCRAVLDQFDSRHRTAVVLNPAISRTQLMRAVLQEYGLKPRRHDLYAYIDTLNRFLFEQAAQGRDVVLLIDEAQNLTFEGLELVRMLSNLETDDRKLLQIVLVGQPELRRRIDHPRLRQLRQRISVRFHLTPLNRREVEHYVRHRIHVGGGNGKPSFSWWANWKIYRYSRGVPRLINAVCDKTLLCGYVMHTDHFTGRHVSRAIRELEGQAA